MFRIVIAAATLLMLAGSATAGTDYQCLNNCTGRGHVYQYCLSQCSYDDGPMRQQPYRQQNPYQAVPPMQQMPQQMPQQMQPMQPMQPMPAPAQQTDYKCLNDCTRKGYAYPLCQQRCSF